MAGSNQINGTGGADGFFGSLSAALGTVITDTSKLLPQFISRQLDLQTTDQLNRPTFNPFAASLFRTQGSTQTFGGPTGITTTGILVVGLLVLGAILVLRS